MNSQVFNQIEQVVNSLDIHRIRMVMEFLEWDWWDGVWAGRVPTQSEIYDMAMQLMEEAYENCKRELTPFCVSTHGLVARCEIVDGEYIFSLSFEVASASNKPQ